MHRLGFAPKFANIFFLHLGQNSKENLLKSDGAPVRSQWVDKVTERTVTKQEPCSLVPTLPVTCEMNPALAPGLSLGTAWGPENYTPPAPT